MKRDLINSAFAAVHQECHVVDFILNNKVLFFPLEILNKNKCVKDKMFKNVMNAQRVQMYLNK